MPEAQRHQIYLTHELAAQSDLELVGGELVERPEMDVARGAYDGVEVRDLRVEPLYRRRVGDVDMEVAPGAADPDDFMAVVEQRVHGGAEGAGGADEDDLHSGLVGRRNNGPGGSSVLNCLLRKSTMS